MPNTVPAGLHYGADSAPALFNRLRTSSKPEESEADIRLSAPYGAGVSRYVRYPEGTEAGKEKRLF